MLTYAALLNAILQKPRRPICYRYRYTSTDSIPLASTPGPVLVTQLFIPEMYQLVSMNQ